MLKRFWAFVTGGRLVWLRDYSGEVTLTIARKDPWGDWQVERWWPLPGVRVRLLPDGKASGLSYIGEWKDADKNSIALWNGSLLQIFRRKGR